MEYDDAVSYMSDLASALGCRPGLARFTELCARLGNPHEKLRCVHVGGTNGKGSTTAMIANILKSAGYRVGGYYSPFVYDLRERVQLDGGMITKASFARLMNAIRPVADEMGRTPFGHPTEFEVKTALAFLYFVEQNVDFAVLEVGLGGRLDTTNIVIPLVSVITNVTLDHMDRLGDTIGEIAGEKAGIVKSGVPLVTAAREPDATDVFRRTCEERGSELIRVSPGSDDRVYSVDDAPTEIAPECDGLTLVGRRSVHPGLKIRMSGKFQFANAATAVAAIEVLQDKGIEVPESAIREGIETAYMPGRLEVLQEKPMLVIDAAHNLDGARQLAHAMETSFSYDRLIVVMGMVKGHSPENAVGTLAPLADEFIATTPNSPRRRPASEIAEVASKYCENVREIEPVTEAVNRALESAGENDLVLVTGSFYTIGEVPRPSAESSPSS
jgi:dihydrofolate synthase/folylpolyglutamate synthase